MLQCGVAFLKTIIQPDLLIVKILTKAAPAVKTLHRYCRKSCVRLSGEGQLALSKVDAH
jgi:hypothetical protein